jgi:L-amino acid N-acyltransferase
MNSGKGHIAVIRTAVVADAQAIASIYNQSIDRGDATMSEETWSATQVLGQIKQFNQSEGYLVSESDGVVIGWGLIKQYSPFAGYRFSCETAVYIDRDERGKGHGKAMKTAIINRCRDVGYHHLVAKILSSNRVSIQYNLSLGYELVGVQKEVGCKQGEWRDVTILQLIID